MSEVRQLRPTAQEPPIDADDYGPSDWTPPGNVTNIDRRPTAERQPPQDVGAEMSVLGGMLLSKDAISDCVTAVKAIDFYRPAHELIYDAILELYARGEPVDAITVADELTKRGNLTRAGGQAYLHQLIAAVPTAANAGYYADIVAERAVLRRLVEAGTRIVQIGYAEGGGEVADLFNAAQGALDDAAKGALDTDAPTHQQAIYQAVDDLEASPGTPTPWAHLTNVIAGWKKQCLYLIGARPAVGKSVAGTTIALDVARRGETAMIFSLEMSRSELYHRLISSAGSVDMTRIQHRKLIPSDWDRVAKASTHLAALPIVVDDRTALSLNQIRAAILEEQRKGPVGVVVIDYLQLITPPSGAPKNDRRVQVDAISRSLKNLAKSCDVPVIALTQLNRGVEGRADKTPNLADLREAGGQEQDADVVLLMHRDVVGTEKPPTELHLIVAKNRHGSSSALELMFRGENSRIEDAPWSPSAHLERNDS